MPVCETQPGVTASDRPLLDSPAIARAKEQARMLAEEALKRGKYNSADQL